MSFTNTPSNQLLHKGGYSSPHFPSEAISYNLSDTNRPIHFKHLLDSAEKNLSSQRLNDRFPLRMASFGVQDTHKLKNLEIELETEEHALKDSNRIFENQNSTKQNSTDRKPRFDVKHELGSLPTSLTPIFDKENDMIKSSAKSLEQNKESSKSTCEFLNKESAKSNPIDELTPKDSSKSQENFQYELSRINNDIRDIRIINIPWEERFDMLAGHLRSCMRNLRILRKEYDDLFGVYETNFRENRKMVAQLND